MAIILSANEGENATFSNDLLDDGGNDEEALKYDQPGHSITATAFFLISTRIRVFTICGKYIFFKSSLTMLQSVGCFLLQKFATAQSITSEGTPSCGMISVSCGVATVRSIYSVRVQ